MARTVTLSDISSRHMIQLGSGSTSAARSFVQAMHNSMCREE